MDVGWRIRFRQRVKETRLIRHFILKAGEELQKYRDTEDLNRDFALSQIEERLRSALAEVARI